MADSKYYLTLSPKARMAFSTLIDPKPFKENGVEKGDPVYSAELLFRPEDMKAFRVEDPNNPDDLVEIDLAVYLSRIAKEAWGSDFNVKEAVATGDLHWPIKKGESVAAKRKGNTEHYDGMKVISVKTGEEYAPGLFYKDENGKEQKVNRAVKSEMETARRLFYSGAYVTVECSLKASIVSGRRYISFYLNSVDFVEAGERLGGGRSLRDRVRGVEGGESAHNPMAGMDEDIPA